MLKRNANLGLVQLNTTINLTAALLVAAAPLHAASPLSIISGTNGRVVVYEYQEFGAPGNPILLTDGQSEPSYAAAQNSHVNYAVDITGDNSTTQIFGIAISYNSQLTGFGNNLGIISYLNPSLAGTSPIFSLNTNVYMAADWTQLSSIPFTTAFNASDDAFIWLTGANPIDATTDVDDPNFMVANPDTRHATREGILNSDFVAFDSGGNIISASSGIPEPSMALLCLVSIVGMVSRRR